VLGERILIVDDADPGDAGALRQPDEVRRMVVAQEPAAGHRQQAVEDGGPECGELGAHAGGRGLAFERRPIPVEQ